MSTAEEQTGQKVIRESYPLSFELLKSGEPAEDYVQMKRELDGWGDMEQSAFWHAYTAASKHWKDNPDQRAISEYADKLAKGTPITRDIRLGLEQGIRDTTALGMRGAAVVSQLWDGGELGFTVDEINRETNRIEQARAIAATKDNAPDWLQTGVAGASRSLYQAAALGPLGEFGIIGGFAASEANQAITDTNDAGLKGKAKWEYVGQAAVIEGGVAGLFSLVGMGGFEKMMGGGVAMRSGLKGLAAALGTVIAPELVEENITEILHAYNKIASGIDPEEMTKEKAYEIFKTTTIQTLLATGATSVFQSAKSQKSLKAMEGLARGWQEMYGWDEKFALNEVHKLAKKKGNFLENAGRFVEDQDRTSPVGLSKWMLANPEKAEVLSGIERPSRTDFTDAGLPKRGEDQRAKVASDLRELLETEATAKAEVKAYEERQGTADVEDVQTGETEQREDEGREAGQAPVQVPGVSEQSETQTPEEATQPETEVPVKNQGKKETPVAEVEEPVADEQPELPEVPEVLENEEAEPVEDEPPVVDEPVVDDEQAKADEEAENVRKLRADYNPKNVLRSIEQRAEVKDELGALSAKIRRLPKGDSLRSGLVAKQKAMQLALNSMVVDEEMAARNEAAEVKVGDQVLTSFQELGITDTPFIVDKVNRKTLWVKTENGNRIKIPKASAELVVAEKNKGKKETPAEEATTPEAAPVPTKAIKITDVAFTPLAEYVNATAKTGEEIRAGLKEDVARMRKQNIYDGEMQSAKRELKKTNKVLEREHEANSRKHHNEMVARQISDNRRDPANYKPVPAEVIADYTEQKSKAPVAEEAADIDDIAESPTAQPDMFDDGEEDLFTQKKKPAVVKSEGHSFFFTPKGETALEEVYKHGNSYYRAPAANAIDDFTGVRIGKVVAKGDMTILQVRESLGLSKSGEESSSLAIGTKDTTPVAKPATKPPAATEAPVDPPSAVRARALEMQMTAAELVDGAKELLAPGARGMTGRVASLIIREEPARMRQRDEVIRAKLHDYSAVFRKMSDPEIRQFIARMEPESGMLPQATAELDEIAAVMRKMLDDMRNMLQGYGLLSDYIKNYFPHLYKNPKHATDVIAGLLSKKRLLPNGFLQKRKYVTLDEGLDAGLELAHYNPVEMLAVRMHEMNRYMAGANIKQRFKESGLAVFVASSMTENYKKSGWVFVDDPAFILLSTPENTTTEAYDKMLYEQLMGVATRLGIDVQTVEKLRKGQLGVSKGNAIKRRVATPLSVFAHEIGHQIDEQYGLFEQMIASGDKTAMRSELDALSDLRHEGETVDAKRIAYERGSNEQAAVILEAWLAAPEKMAKVAPTITSAWKSFLAANEDVSPLLNLDRSVVLDEKTHVFKQDGVTEIGKWAVQKEAATILNRYLQPGLSANPNIWIRGTYNGVRQLRNLALMMSHGLSGFHSINTAGDAVGSRMGLAFEKLSRGDWAGFDDLMKAPGAFVSDIALGRKIKKAGQLDLDQITDPHMRFILDSILRAGGSLSMDSAYRNNARVRLVDSVRAARVGNTAEKLKTAGALPFNVILAAFEVASYPIMEYQVPALKLGVFSHMAEDIHKQALENGWSETKISDELAKSWDNVENRMGQMNYDNLHWNKILKDTVVMTFRAFGWTYGSIREFGGGMWDTASIPLRVGGEKNLVGKAIGIDVGKPIMTRKMGYMLGSAVSYAVQSAIIQYLFTAMNGGEPEEPREIKDLFFPRTGRKNADGSDERLSLPHYSKDIVAWFTSPAKTLQHKLNPTIGVALDLYQNEDYFGRQIREGGNTVTRAAQGVGYAAESMFTPFSWRNYKKYREQGDSITKAAVVGFSGIGPAPAHLTRSPAQKLMIGILRGRGGGGSHKPQAEADKSNRRRDIVKEKRSGKKITAERLKEFSSREQQNIDRQASKSAFAASFARLSFDEALNVFRVASEEEQAQSWEMLAGKRGREISPDQDSLKGYYELKLGQGQSDLRMATDVQIIRNAAMRLTSSDLSDVQRTELLEAMTGNPEYEDDLHFAVAAFRHRWVFSPTGKRTGRRVGTPAYRKRVLLLVRTLKEN